MYTLESLRPLNGCFDADPRLEQNDVEFVNACVTQIENTRKETPCLGDIVDYTDEYGDYYRDSNIYAMDDKHGCLSLRAHPHVPFVCRLDDVQGVSYYLTGGGMSFSLDATTLTYVGKRERLFMVSGHCGVVAHCGIYFKATVNVWEYTAPNQKYPGYSTKDWAKRFIYFTGKTGAESVYCSSKEYSCYKTDLEYRLENQTFNAVEFASEEPGCFVIFHYREKDKLVSRKEWDALELPLDTRYVNGIIHVKVAYDDIEHTVTSYRFTNSGYLDCKLFGPYARAKGTLLAAPGPDIKDEGVSMLMRQEANV